MQTRVIRVQEEDVECHFAGEGPPILYLHGIFDVHTLQPGFFAFHEQLASRFAVTAPAHPGCGSSTGVKRISDIEDLAFHYFDVLDALKIEQATVIGFDLGAWIAAEMAVRDPSRFHEMVLIGAAGLQAPDCLIGDVFMYSQHRDGGVMQELRQLLFADPDGALATRLIADGRVEVPNEVRRYRSLTLTGRVGWEPPYLHNRKLARRLHRVRCPTLLVWGGADRFIPLANAHRYRDGIRQSALAVVEGAGHSVIFERPEGCVELISNFLAERSSRSHPTSLLEK